MSVVEEKITIKKYKINGQYTDGRSQLHYNILYVFLKGKNPIPIPKAILLGGGSGAGKSTIVDKFMFNYESASAKDDFVYIDSDQIKLHIPEYHEYKGNDDVVLAAFYVHEESSDIVTQLIEICVQQKYSFIYDGTMSWKPYYDQLIALLEQHHYFIQGAFVDIEEEIAVQRMYARGLDTGRFVPEDIVRESNRKAPITYHAIQHKFSISSIYNNSFEPELIYYRREKVEDIHNVVAYEQFLEKALKNRSYHTE